MEEEILRDAPDERCESEGEDERHDDGVNNADNAGRATADECSEGHTNYPWRLPAQSLGYREILPVPLTR